MSAAVVKFPGGTIGPLSPIHVLRGVAIERPAEVFIIAMAPDGGVSLHGSHGGLQFNLALVERARHRLVKMMEGET